MQDYGILENQDGGRAINHEKQKPLATVTNCRPVV